MFDKRHADLAIGEIMHFSGEIADILDEMPSMSDEDVSLAKQDGCEMLDEIRIHLNVIERYLS